MSFMSFFTETQPKIHWGGASAFWDICRHKAIGIPVLDLLNSLTQDPELKLLIQTGIDMIAIPHIKKIQDIMEKENVTYPPMPTRNTMSDKQIGLAIAEILRLSILLDNIGFMSVTRDDLRKAVWDITLDDKKAFDKIIQLLYQKGWIENPPSASN